MYLKMMWCYVFILTLLDISLNTKLTAQGKSHGVTVQDPLRFIERIPFQEGAGAAPAPAEALRLWPPALAFGRCELARPHVLTVTLTNTHNGTMHLASVAGTTPDFHASFFDSKTLPPDANTSFSVVFLGRREGAAAALLYIHTSLGVIKYPVSAEGVASAWDVWPLVGVRLPHNATVDPLLTMHNPTDHTIQVSEVYSSGAWLGLQLPDGAGAAPRALWALPPHSTRPLVRLRLQAAAEAGAGPLTAYVRIKASVPGGALVVPVEARPAPPGEHLQPLQLRLRPRGSRDPPLTSRILAGSSAAAALPAAAALRAARCRPAPHAAPPPADLDPDRDHTLPNGRPDRTTANGVKAGGVHVSSLRTQLDPRQPLTPTAQLTFDFAKMWETYMSDMEAEGAEGAAAGAGAWCSGWVGVGRAALPYSVRLLPGTLRLLPDALHVVTANMEEAFREREVRVHNEFSSPVRLLGLQLGPSVRDYFHVTETGGGPVGPGETAVAGRVRLTKVPARGQLDTWLAVRTDGSEYRLPLRLHGGRLRLRWRWPHGERELRLGALPVSATRRVRLALHNPTPEPLCVRELRAELAGAQLELDSSERCVPPGGELAGWLTVVAPARPGPLHGAVLVRTQHAATLHNVSLHAHTGRLVAHALHLPDAAPYACRPVPLVVESTMAVTMRALDLHHDRPERDLLTFMPAGAALIAAGRQTVGAVQLAAEALCRPRCYTGLSPHEPEGAAWVARGAAPAAGSAAALAADAALFAARRALFAAARALDDTLYLHTEQVVRLAVPLAARAAWPRLTLAPARAALAGLGQAAPLDLVVGNPSHTHALLLQPLFADSSAPVHHIFFGAESGEAALAACGADCAWDSSAFALSGWRARAGAAREWAPAAAGPPPRSARVLPLLLLEPRAEVVLDVTFTPAAAAASLAYLYLRNNLTILEAATVSGRGVLPSFELAGRRPGAAEPLLFEVSACGAESGVVRRAVHVRNTGAVPLRLRDWRLAGRACAARGFRLQPCAPLALRPNETRALALAFSPDYTLARVRAALSVASDAGRAEFTLAAVAPARLLPACAAALPPPPFDAALRAAGSLLALAALALVLAAAALDAERELRRARADRPPAAPAPALRRPLDLRACHEPRAAAAGALAPRPAAAAPRRRRPPRRAAPLDPQAERRAFERWRAEVLRRAPASDDHSSEDADAEPDAETDCTPPPEPAAAEPAAADEDTDCSSPPDDRSEPEEPDDRDAGAPPDDALGDRHPPDDKRDRVRKGRIGGRRRRAAPARARLASGRWPGPAPARGAARPAAGPARRAARPAATSPRAGDRPRRPPTAARPARPCRRRPRPARRAAPPPGARWWRAARRRARRARRRAGRPARGRARGWRPSGRTCGGAARTRCSTSTSRRRPPSPPSRGGRGRRTPSPRSPRSPRTSTERSAWGRWGRWARWGAGRCGAARAAARRPGCGAGTARGRRWGRGRGPGRGPCARRPASTAGRGRRRAPTTPSARSPPSGGPPRSTGGPTAPTRTMRRRSSHPAPPRPAPHDPRPHSIKPL